MGILLSPEDFLPFRKYAQVNARVHAVGELNAARIVPAIAISSAVSRPFTIRNYLAVRFRLRPQNAPTLIRHTRASPSSSYEPTISFYVHVDLTKLPASKSRGQEPLSSRRLDGATRITRSPRALALARRAGLHPHRCSH